MHQYLRAVGFSDIHTKKQLKALMNDVITNPTQKDYIESEENSIMVEYSKNYSTSCGITLRGEYDENEQLTLDFYYPYAVPQSVATTQDASFERHADKESFLGVCDDVRIGVSLIYYVQNGMYLMKQNRDDDWDRSKISMSFAALSLGGTIMLPIKKDPKVMARHEKASAARNKRIIAAKNGDEEAIEQLTLEDIDTYSAISRRILKDDIFTLVDTYFMPYGAECDHYSIMAEIEDYRLETNYLTGEEMYLFELNCNNMPITVCVNRKDVLGEPEIGRRFRGNIWLQGQISV